MPSRVSSTLPLDGAPVHRAPDPSSTSLRPAGFVAALSAFGFLLLAVSTLQARGLDPFDIATMRSVGSVVSSPDGNSIAYTLSVPRDLDDQENGPAWSELYVYDVPSRRQLPFVTGTTAEGETVSAVRFHPDGSGITFLAKRHGEEHRSLYLIPLHGGEARRILSYDEDIKEYALSPDGRRVAFLAVQPESEEHEALKEKGFDMEFYQEDARFTRIFIEELDGEGPRKLSIEGSAADLSWSPVDARLLVSLTEKPLIDQRYMARRFYVIDPDAPAESGDGQGRIVATLETVGKLGEAQWSPDAEHIALIGSVDLHDPAAGRLYVASSHDGSVRDLLPDFAGHVRHVGFKDSQTLVYLADVGVHTVVGSLGIAGGTPSVLYDRPHPVFTSMSLSRDGRRMAFVGEGPTHPAELFLASAGDRPQRVTDSNPWLADRELAAQEVISFAARDDLELQGILVHPLHEEPDHRFPLIVTVHGGPESHERDGWKTYYSRAGQFGAAEGFAVFYPNYRGSTGRGVEFSKLSQGDPAGKEFDDIVDGVDHLIDIGLVDRDRVGITGGSYGGFATAWGASYYSDRFAAAVMFVGISEHFAKFGTTDIPDEAHLVHQWPRKYYEDWDFYLDRSPFRHTAGSRTPLLILHGKNDPRVHPSQSMIMYRYFEQTADAPVRLVWYPGEGHGNRKAAGRLDYSLRLMRWMKRFLVDGGPEQGLPEMGIDHSQPAEGMVGVGLAPGGANR